MQRMLPPDIGNKVRTVHGRTYSAGAALYLDVPNHDAPPLVANGWTQASTHGVGTTAQRPASNAVGLTRGSTYIDTTLSYMIVWDGADWHNPVTGAIV